MLVVSIGGNVFLWLNSGNHQEQLEPTTTITIVGDTTPEIVFFPEPVPVWRDTGSTRWRSLPVDTNAILTDYFSRNAYLRILKEDSSALIVLSDTVTQNRLTAFRLEFINRRQTAIITSTYQVPQMYDFILSGVISLSMMPERTRLMGGLMLTDRQQRTYQVMTDPQMKSWQVGMSMPVWRWQRKVIQSE